MLKFARSLTSLLFLSLLAGCDDNTVKTFSATPNTEPLAATVRAGIPMAYAAAAAFQAAEGYPMDNAIALPTCSSYPCSSLITISLDGSGYPAYVDQPGSVEIAAHFTAAGEGVFIATLFDITIGSENFASVKLGVFPAMRTVDGVRIVYAGVDFNVENGPASLDELSDQELQDQIARLGSPVPQTTEVALSSNVWIIDMHDNGTEFDLTDDSYEISGGGQSFDVGNGVSLLQAAMVGATIIPECSANPVSGLAVIQEINIPGDKDSPVLGQAILTFHERCDGKARITLGNGNYIGSTGQTVRLNIVP